MFPSVIKKQCLELNIPNITGDAEDVLVSLILKHRPKKVLEIGSGIGYSGAVICGLDDMLHLTTLEKDEERFKLVQQNLGEYNALCINTDCNEWLKENKKKFDFIFLDGPKGKYDLMLPDIVRAMNDGAVLVADNVFFHGLVTGEAEVTKGARTLVRHLQKFLEDVKLYKELNVQILNKGDGILIAERKGSAEL